jgi:hypothetical protein
VLEYRLRGHTLSYRWANAVPGFDMPVRATLSPGTYTLLRPTERWKTATVRLRSAADFKVDENFYVEARDADHPAPAASATSPQDRAQVITKH